MVMKIYLFLEEVFHLDVYVWDNSNPNVTILILVI